MDAPTQNRRQRVDAARAKFERASTEQTACEAREMSLDAELETAKKRTEEATIATVEARVALREALAYQDPTPAAPAEVEPRALAPQGDFDDDAARAEAAGLV